VAVQHLCCTAPWGHRALRFPAKFAEGLQEFFYFLKMIAIPADSHLQNGAVLAYSVGIDLEISSRIMQLTSK
jgi:hypothetical protein